jgi:hypothetical protein
MIKMSEHDVVLVRLCPMLIGVAKNQHTNFMLYLPHA